MSLKTVIRQVFDNPPFAPYVMLGGTDCQHFVPVCDHIYRFTSLVMDERFRGLEHGIDERIPVEGMANMVKFYAQLMQVWGTKELAAWLGRFLGRQRMARLGGFVARNAAGWGTNVSLGFLLGFTPAIGSFLGIPMDVRHVTLSSGMLAIAAASMDTTVFSWGWFFWGVAGVGTMFVLNLSVSFILSLNNAAQAYGYTTREVVRLLGTLVRWFIQHPLSFILPPRNRSATSASVRM